MGGDGTFIGTGFQARVIAYCYAHLLSRSPLRWVSPLEDVPIAVSGESGGAGDDVRVETRGVGPAIEVQAKKGISAGAQLRDFVAGALGRDASAEGEPLVLAVDRNSSKKVHDDLALDLERMRSGRHDGLHSTTQDLLSRLPDAMPILLRLRVVPLDLRNPGEPDHKVALMHLEHVLENPDQSSAALEVLVADAGRLCADRLRRDRTSLADLLQNAGIRVAPLSEDAEWEGRLKFTKALLDDRHVHAALTALTNLEQDLRERPVGSSVRYRLHQQRGVALLRLERLDEAIREGMTAQSFQRDRVEAHQVVALAAMQKGDIALAIEQARAAVALVPDGEVAWSTLTQVEAAQGGSITEPPPEVGSASAYREALAQVAANRGDWPAVLSLTDELLADGLRSPETLFLRCVATFSQTGIASRSDCVEVEALATEIIDTIRNERHPVLANALVMRAKARSILGRNEEGEADAARARSIDPEDPELISQTARSLVHRGDVNAALDVLEAGVVDFHPTLLALRAQLLAQSSPDRARDDLDACLALLPDLADQRGARLSVAETATVLRDGRLAESLLRDLPKLPSGMAAWRETIRGRIAFQAEDIEAGKSRFRAAVEIQPEKRSDILVELANHLRGAGAVESALSVLGELDESERPPNAVRLYVDLLFSANRWDEAHSVLMALHASGSPPDWVLRGFIQLAVRREDPANVVETLAELVDRDREDIGARLELARHLVMLERVPDAEIHIDWLSRLDPALLSPQEEMLVAELELAAHHDEAAFDRAYRAFRDGHTEAEIHKAFATLHLRSGAVFARPSHVGPGVGVRLTGADANRRTYIVTDGWDPDPARQEISVEAAVKLGVIGLKVGDSWVEHEGTWRQTEWVVDELIPARIAALQDVMMGFETRFPAEPFSVASFPLGDGNSVRDFAPLVASSVERREHVEEVIGRYREDVLPLGLVSRLTGVPVFDLMSALGHYDGREAIVWVEWSDLEGQRRARQTAREASDIVVSASTLQTLSELGLLDEALDRLRPLAPLSARAEAKTWYTSANAESSQGRRSISVRPDGRPDFEELAPDHPAVQARRERCGELLQRLEAMELRPRPLDTLAAPDAEHERLRNMIGPAHMDSVLLAKSLGLPLVADDLGLRRIAKNFGLEDSFSSISLLQVLAEEGRITSRTRDEALLRLVDEGYATIIPTPQLLLAALQPKAGGHNDRVRRAFGLLGRPSWGLDEGVAVAAHVIRQVATADVRLESVGSVVRYCLSGLSARWPLALRKNSLLRQCAFDLKLLPKALDEAREAIDAYVEEG